MEFEWDDRKSEANEAKHGIPFDEARALWGDRLRVEFELEHAGEQRRGLIARYGGSVWFAVWCRRGAAVRIISVRRATDKEAGLYDRINADR